MPNEPFLESAFADALDDLVGAVVLLVAADDLDAALLLVGGVEGKVLQQVEQAPGLEEVGELLADFAEAEFLHEVIGLALEPPGRPELERAAHRAIIEFLPLGGEGEQVRHEELGDAVLVDVVNLVGAIEPTHGGADGRLGLADDDGNAVDEQDDVRDLGFQRLDGILVGDDEAVVVEGVEINQAHRHVAIVLAEGHGLVAAEPGVEFLVGPDEAGLVGGDETGAELVDDLVGEGGIGGDLGIDPDQGLAQFALQQDLVGRPVQGFGGTILPRERSVGSGVFLYDRRRHVVGIQIHTAELLNDVVLDAVEFVEGHGWVIGFRRGDSMGLGRQCERIQFI